MSDKQNIDSIKEQSNEIKQSFLSSAIVDISTYIQLADTKVSIIMGSLVALTAGIISCYELIERLVSKLKPCTWTGTIFIVLALFYMLSVLMVFIFGILTIRGHESIINYKSKWFLVNSTKEYFFDTYLQDIKAMTDEDIIENMAAELYKLNDINRQKSKTMKWVMFFFAIAIVTLFIVGFLLMNINI